MSAQWASGNVATITYRDLLTRRVGNDERLLHAGCGWDKKEITRPLLRTARIFGVDLDRGALAGYHSPCVQGTLSTLPIADSSMDAIVCEYVVEHLDDPPSAFGEFARVLRPSGRLLLLTPNLYSYKSIVAATTPHGFHEAMGRIRYGEGHERDMYPTLYRCNTPGRLRRDLEGAGFEDVELQLVNNGPTWFTRFPVLFGVGNLLHHLMNARMLAALRCAIVVEARRA